MIESRDLPAVGAAARGSIRQRNAVLTLGVLCAVLVQ
jgi:hypothetical protein